MEKLVTIEDLFPKYKKKVIKLLKNLDLENPALRDVENSYRKKDFIGCCKFLLMYYEKNRNPDWVDFKDYHATYLDQLDEVNDISQDIFTFLGKRLKVPRMSSGNLDWSFIGPDKDKEIGYFFNRHHFLQLLYLKYVENPDPNYAKQYNDILQDWLVSNPRPKFYKSCVQWRTLEAALRVMWVWTFTFFGFLHSDEFKPATKILFLCSIYDHATYCKKYVVPRGNIRVMIMASLATMGAIWPEFRDSKAWISHSLKVLEPEISYIQVYPDGSQKELTNHYHFVSARHFEQVAQMAEKAGIMPHANFKKRLEEMWNYYIYCVRPSRHGLLNNDSDYDYLPDWTGHIPDLYSREDWKYILSFGKQGTLPKCSSILFPWAGHMIFRSGWEIDASFAFFDIGPYGTGHQHNDKLHLTLASHGRDLLVDSGRYWYVNDIWRKYFRNTSAHNTIIVNKKGQNSYKKEASTPIAFKGSNIAENFEYAIGRYEHGYNDISLNVSHIRCVVFVEKKFWIVIDSIDSHEKPVDFNYSVLWHFHPHCSVESDGLCIFTSDKDKGNLRITPSQNIPWKLDVIKGREPPDIQGWYSERYNMKTPSHCAEYNSNGHSAKNPIFAWLITTNKGLVPPTSTFEITESSDFRVELKYDNIHYEVVYNNKTHDGVEIFKDSKKLS